MRKTKEEAYQTRCNLLAAALTVFYERGVSKASLDEIAKTAGVTRGALYWHFKNKKDLFEALLQIHYANVEQQLEQVLHSDQTTEPLDFLYNSVLQHFESLVNDHDFRKFNTILLYRCEQTQDNLSIVELTRQYHRRWDLLLHNIINECKRKQILDQKLNTERAVLSLISTISGLSASWLDDPQAFDLMQHAPAIIQACFDNLKNSPFLRDTA